MTFGETMLLCGIGTLGLIGIVLFIYALVMRKPALSKHPVKSGPARPDKRIYLEFSITDMTFIRMTAEQRIAYFDAMREKQLLNPGITEDGTRQRNPFPEWLVQMIRDHVDDADGELQYEPENCIYIAVIPGEVPDAKKFIADFDTDYDIEYDRINKNDPKALAMKADAHPRITCKVANEAEAMRDVENYLRAQVKQPNEGEKAESEPQAAPLGQ